MDSLQQLATVYARKLPQYCQRIESYWIKASIPGASQKSIDQLILQCHRLSGSAASYGLGKVALVASSIEQAAKQLKDCNLPSGSKELEDTEHLIEQLIALGSQVQPDSLQQSVEDTIDRRPISNTKPLVYVVDDDPDQGTRLGLQLVSHGFETVVFEQLNELREAVLAQMPAAIVADIVFPEGDTAGIEAMAALRHAGSQPLPVVFISRRTDSEARLLALRAGGSGYFTKPVSPPSLAAKLHELTDQVDQHPFRIMIVDDDSSTNMLHSAVLKKAGCEVSSLTDPLKVIKEAFSFRPELIFMDLYMPEANGLEVAMMLRQEETFLDVPIVFLSGEDDQDIKARAIKEGAASFLSKPVSATNLVDVANSRAHQYRARAIKTRYFGRIEPITGLFTRDYLFTVLGNHCTDSDTRTGLLALLIIDIDNYGSLFRSFGEDHIRLLRAKVAHMIRTCIGEHDVAASYTDSSFLILAQQTDMPHLERFVNKLHQTMTEKATAVMGHNYKLAVSIGVAKVSGNDQNQILSEASLASNEAHSGGGNQVQFHSHLRHDALEQGQLQHLKRQIKDAIKNRRIFLSYSPVVGVAIESEERFTILMRLRDSDGKVLYPADFIPVAQKFNIMSGLDRWTIRTALQALGEEQKTSPETQFFIKLSRASILDREFTVWLKTVLKRHPVQLDSCIFEIKEEDLAGNLDRVQDFNNELHTLHCGLSIERYGRNEDSFLILHLLQPSYLRLDLSLLHNLSTDQDTQDRIKTICDHAHKHGSKVLTAYIQDSQALALLWRVGVDYIQGDFLEQPEDPRQQDDPLPG